MGKAARRFAGVVGAAAATMIAGVATAPRSSEGAASLLLGSRAMGEDSPKSTTVLDVGLAMYTLGPAVVHAAHGRPIASMGSAAMRAVGPTAGLFVGLAYGILIAIPVAAVEPGNSRGSLGIGENASAVIVAGVVSGTMLGAIGPMVIDAVALAREPGEKAKEVPKDPAATVSLQPRLGYTKDGPTVGLSGTF